MDIQTNSHPSLSRSLDTVREILQYDVVVEIEQRMSKWTPVVIADIGCGVGRSLWEISDRHVARSLQLELHGIYLSNAPDK